MEVVLIKHFLTELNTKKEKINILNDLSVVHIQNFTGKIVFLNDYMIF